MIASLSQWFYLLPELWIGALGLLLLILDLKGHGHKSRALGLLTAGGLLLTIPLILWQTKFLDLSLLSGMYRIDALALFFKGFFVVTAALVTLMARDFSGMFERGHAEFYLLILSATLGMMFTASAGNFIMLFVAMELITISFYVMTSYLQTSPKSLEAGVKYLILGALSSAFFLYGIAFVYGMTGSTQFAQIRSVIQENPHLPLGLAFGLILILGGILFKGAGVPFHLWVPDVYEGAPTPVVGFLSVGSKAAGFVVALRLLYEIFLPVNAHWTSIIAVLAGLTILYGNLGAIPQKNMKRLLGYSSIGHAGYLLIGIATCSQLGPTAVTFYLTSYLFTNLAIFLVVSIFSARYPSDSISDYAGLSRRSPFLAAVMFISLLSLAGVPPLSGFFAKFLLLMSAVSQGYLWLAMIGAGAVVVSLYYYLLIVKTMYVDPPADPAPIPVSFPTRIALVGCLAAIFGIGIWQAPFLALSYAAVRNLF